MVSILKDGLFSSMIVSIASLPQSMQRLRTFFIIFSFLPNGVFDYVGRHGRYAAGKACSTAVMPL
jgi:hypothetical protein